MPKKHQAVIAFKDGKTYHYKNVIECTRMTGSSYETILRAINSGRKTKTGWCFDWRYEFYEEE